MDLKETVSQKEHRCYGCGNVIDKGDNKMTVKIFEPKPITKHFCELCSEYIMSDKHLFQKNNNRLSELGEWEIIEFEDYDEFVRKHIEEANL